MKAFDNMKSSPQNCYIKKDGKDSEVLNSTSLDTHEAVNKTYGGRIGEPEKPLIID